MNLTGSVGAAALALAAMTALGAGCVASIEGEAGLAAPPSPTAGSGAGQPGAPTMAPIGGAAMPEPRLPSGAPLPPAAGCPVPAGSLAPGARVVRLTRLELGNALADLFGQAASVLDIEGDTRGLGFSTGEGRSVTPTYFASLKRIAEASSATFRKTVAAPGIAATCFASDSAARACTDKLVRDLGKRVYRRPLDDGQVGSLLGVYDAGRETAGVTEPAERMRAGLDWVIRALIQSPSFIFRTELGDPAAPGGTPTRLTAHELATAIAFAVTASPPDAELLAAAEAGKLATADGIAVQVTRLASARVDRFRGQMARFVTEWLGIDLDSVDWNKKSSVYPLYSPALKEAFRQELHMFVDEWAGGQVSSLARLLTSNDTFVNRASASVYGLPMAAMAMQKATLDARQRSGILTQGAFLGTHAHTDSSSPVLRGLTLRMQLFCLTVPAPPGDLPPLPPADKLPRGTTTRQRFDGHIVASGPACTACHASFNPMGNAFENYDGIGAHRTTENGSPVDGSGAIVGTAQSDRSVANGVEMAQALAASPEVQECFARQAFRYTAGRLDGEYDQCSIRRSAQTSAGKGLDVKEMLAALIASESFTMRRTAKETP